MSRGRRYEEPKLNMKKVFAVIIAILVIVMSILMIKGIFSIKGQKKLIGLGYFVFYKQNKIICKNSGISLDILSVICVK